MMRFGRTSKTEPVGGAPEGEATDPAQVRSAWAEARKEPQAVQADDPPRKSDGDGFTFRPGPGSNRAASIQQGKAPGADDSTASGTQGQKKKKLGEKDAISMMGLVAEHDSKLVINPDRNKIIGKWDAVTTAALIFVAAVTPVEVGLMETSVNALFFVNRAIDVIFLCDLVLQFFLMYPVQTRYGRRLEHRHRKIVRHYLSTWFPVDLLSVLPLDALGLIFSSEGLKRAKAVKVIRLLRLLKLTKALRASRLLRKAEVNLSITYQRLNLIKFFVMLAVASHWQACLWAMTLQLVEGDTPRWIDSITASEKDAGFTELTQDVTWKLYVTSAYFASYTMTSVGYGDIYPVNAVERCICLVLLFWAGITWAYIIGQVSHIVGAMDAHEQRFRQTMDDLNFMMEDRNLPQAMRRRLRSFFLYNKDVQRYSQHRKLLEKMSPALQGEVALTANAIWIEKVSFLSEFVQGISPDPQTGKPLQKGVAGFSSAPAFVVDIALSLETLTYAQEEQFGKPHTLFVLNRGLAGRGMAVLRSGSVWGEDFVLRDQSLQQPSLTWALTYVELSTLERSTFMAIVESHKHVHWKLNMRVRRFCVRLACQRGILREAKRRQQLAKAKEAATKSAEDEGEAGPQSNPTKVSTFAMAPSDGSDLRCSAREPGRRATGRNRSSVEARIARTRTSTMDPQAGSAEVDGGLLEIARLREEVSQMRSFHQENNGFLRRLVEAIGPTSPPTDLVRDLADEPACLVEPVEG